MYRVFGILLVCSFVLSSTFVYAQADVGTQDKDQIVRAINNMMKFSAGDMMKKNIKSFSDTLIAQEVPQEIVQEIISKVDTKQADGIAVKIFSQYFTIEDARAINEFYESTAGKKFAQAMPLFAGEYLKQSSEFSFKIYQGIFEQLKDKGYPLEDLRKIYLSPTQFSDAAFLNVKSPAVVNKK